MHGAAEKWYIILHRKSNKIVKVTEMAGFLTIDSTAHSFLFCFLDLTEHIVIFLRAHDF